MSGAIFQGFGPLVPVKGDVNATAYSSFETRGNFYTDVAAKSAAVSSDQDQQIRSVGAATLRNISKTY